MKFTEAILITAGGEYCVWMFLTNLLLLMLCFLQKGFKHRPRTECTLTRKGIYRIAEIRIETKPPVLVVLFWGSPATHLNLGGVKEKVMSNESQILLHQDRGSNDRQTQVKEQEEKHKPWTQSLKGILAAFLSVFMYVVGVTNLQLLQRRVPDLELQVFRSFGVVIISLIAMLLHQKTPKIPLPDIPAMFLYGVIMTLYCTALYIGFSLISETLAQSADTTCCLLSGLLIFWLCGQEMFNFKRALFAMLCLAGVLFIIQPWYSTHLEATKEYIPKWYNDSGDCIPQLQKLCPLTEEIQLKVNWTPCKNYTLPTTNATKIPISCEGLLTKKTAADQSNNLHFNCLKWISCWLNATGTGHFTGPRSNEKKTVVFQQLIQQKYVNLLGIVSAGFSGVTFSLLGAVFKKYECLYEDKWRCMFWSFLLCLICSTTLTFVIECPGWPESLFDTIAVFLHASTSAAGWVCLVFSLQHISGSTFNIIASTTVVFLLIPQYTILTSILPGHKNWMEVAGVFIVLSGSIMASALEMFAPSEISLCAQGNCCNIGMKHEQFCTRNVNWRGGSYKNVGWFVFVCMSFSDCSTFPVQFRGMFKSKLVVGCESGVWSDCLTNAEWKLASL